LSLPSRQATQAQARRPQRNRRNSEIRVPQVSVIDKTGKLLGPMPTTQAMALATQAGLDLVEIQAQQRPPLCKILDWGKFRFEEQKKERTARKNHVEIVTKEIQLRPTIADHDWDVKMRSAESFLRENMRVQIVLRFRGREITHAEIGREVIESSIARLAPLGYPMTTPRLEGKLLQVILLPGKPPKVKPPVGERVPGRVARPVRPSPSGAASVSAAPRRDAGADSDVG